MKVLIGCECSGRVRQEFRLRGHDAWSCDLKPAEDGSPYHIQGNVLNHLDGYFPGHGQPPFAWDIGIFHPECTYPANSGVQWLKGNPERWRLLNIACDFFIKMWKSRTLFTLGIAIENPVMHCYAKERISAEENSLFGEEFKLRVQIKPTQIVQPWWFGDEAFKATCLWLAGLPALVPTNKLTPPKIGTEEHKRWSKVHREPPGPNRKANRSRTFQGLARAMAEQWGTITPPLTTTHAEETA